MQTINKTPNVSNREIVQADALAIAIKNNRCGLGISMGVGKTRIAIQHLSNFYDQFIKALVVIPKWSVKDSWVQELELMNKSILLEHIEFTTYISLKKKDPKSYDLLYLDECHSLKESHDSFLSNFSGRILGMTGTPPKDRQSEKVTAR